MTEKSTETTMPRPPVVRRWWRLLFLMLIFLSGSIVGAICGGYWMREHMVTMMQHPEKVPDRILPRIRSELALSDDQAQKVEAVVRRRHAAMEALRAECYPRQLAEFKAMQSEIAELLLPEQRRQWVTLCETVERRYLPVRPIVPPPAEVIFFRFDANNDGALTDDETPAGMWRHLQVADQDADGKVTREEYLQARKKVNSD